MTDQVREKTITQCVGRFCLDVPESMRRSPGSYEIADTEFEEQILGPPLTGAYERIWLAHLAQIETLKKNRNYPGDLYGEILDRKPLTPSLTSVLFHEKMDHNTLTLGALLDAGPVALWMKLDGSTKYVEKMIDCVKAFANEYQPQAKDRQWPAPGKDWFYLHLGAFATKPKYEEKADIDFEGHPLKVKLTGAMAVMTGDSAISLVRKGTRKVAGFKGEELLVRDSNAKQLVFMWSYSGEVDSAKKPSIEIEMETRDDGHLDEKTALWNALLDSMRPVVPR
jgi:hypothetical protein